MTRLLIGCIIALTACGDATRSRDAGADAFDIQGADLRLFAGYDHTCALRSNGTLICWGKNDFGQLGLGTINPAVGDNELVTQVTDVGEPVVHVAPGDDHTCVITQTNKLKCWGNNMAGAVGSGVFGVTGDDELAEDLPAIDTGYLAFSVGAGYRHSCVGDELGKTVKCFGINFSGELGLGDGNTDVWGDDEAVKDIAAVDVGSDVAAILGGDYLTCVHTIDKKVRCWGDNTWGQTGTSMPLIALGDDESPSSVPTVNVGADVDDICVGTTHVCVLTDGAVRCWGDGTTGGLGYGNADDIGDDETPASAGVVPLGNEVAVAIACGGGHTCAILQGGGVRCWGRNEFGQLGYGDTEKRGMDGSTTPDKLGNVLLSGPATDIAAGRDHTCAVIDDQNITCWGRGEFGALGYGSKENVADKIGSTPQGAGFVTLPD